MGETWPIWGANGTEGSSGPWVLLDSGTGNNSSFTFNVTGGHNWIVVYGPRLNTSSGGNSNDILLVDVTTEPVQGAFVLFAAGFLGCVVFLRPRVRQD